MSCARYYNPRLRKRILAGDEPTWLLKHPRRQYIRQCILACPDWVDRRELNALRDIARRATAFLGVEYVLDHIVPLNNQWVCGLHVPWNIAIKTRAANAAKSNIFCPDQLELL